MDTILCEAGTKQAASGRRTALTDAFGRDITYLRLSVTDRCNLRCSYCMGEDVKFLPRCEVLTLEEMERLAAAFIRLGVRKLRLTGGEPLARPGIMGLIAHLGRQVAARRLDELTLTTNGTLLARQVSALAAAGVRRVNVSLDTLDRATFRRISRHDDLPEVLDGIYAARAAGLAVRINTVAMAGVNDLEFDRLIDWCGDHDCDMALIELMPLGGSRARGQHYLRLDWVRERLERHWTLQDLPARGGDAGPGRYVTVAETGRRLGFITPMSHGFCASCNRVRLTCAGTLVPCLASEQGIDLRPALRGSESDEALEAAICAAVAKKPLAHRLDRAPAESRPMWEMGG